MPPAIDTIRLAQRTGEPEWNGVPLGGLIDTSSWAVLDTYLQQSGQLEPMPYVTLDFRRGTSCKAVWNARALMRRHLQCSRSGRCFQGPSPDRHVN